MFSLFRRRGTIIAEGLKIVGSVTAEGLVEVNGHIEGDLHCTSLVVSPKASINGGIEADKIVVNGRVEGMRLRDDLAMLGLATGDLLVAIDGRRVTSADQVLPAFQAARERTSILISRAQRFGTIELVEH